MVAAIAEAAPAVPAETTGAQTQADADSTIIAPTLSGAAVDIPRDPADGVRLETAAGNVLIDLPVGRAADDAAIVNKTAVYTDARPQTTVAVQPTAEGARALAVLEGPDVPKRLTYPLSVPNGAILRLTDDGGAEVVIARIDPESQQSVELVLATVSPAWAKDANQTAVPTHYEVAGTR